MPIHGAGAGTTCVQVPSSEAVLAEGVLNPRARRTSPGGGVEPSSEADSARGTSNPRARRTPPEGAPAVPPWRAAGATRVVIVSCMCFRFVG
jgi:hypothetical protein